MNDVDILASSDRRRARTAQEKAALLAEIDAEGGKVRPVAGRHNMSESVLYNWRSARKAAAVATGAAENVKFIPAGIIEGRVSRAVPVAVPAAPEREPVPRPPSAPGANKTSAIEITLPNGTRLTSSPDQTPAVSAPPPSLPLSRPQSSTTPRSQFARLSCKNRKRTYDQGISELMLWHDAVRSR